MEEPETDVLPTSIAQQSTSRKDRQRVLLIRSFIVPEPDDRRILSWPVVLARAELSVLTFTTAQPSAGPWADAEKKTLSTARAQNYQTRGWGVEEFVEKPAGAEGPNDEIRIPESNPKDEIRMTNEGCHGEFHV